MPSIARPLGGILLLLLALANPAAAQAGPREPHGRVVRQLRFEGNHAISNEVLARAISTTQSSWFARAIPFRWFGVFGEKRYLDQQEFRRDVVRLEVLYKRSGYPDVQIDTTVRRTPENAYITFHIREGEPTRVTAFNVTGLDSLPAWLRRVAVRDLPLRQRDPFNRFEMQAAADSVATRLKDRGYPSARVFSSFETNRNAHTASVTLDVIPGHRAVIGTVDVVGAQRVDTGLIRQLMVARPGRRFSQDELFQSQRNLYQSDLFRFAAVGIDSAELRADADTVPLTVQVSESRRRRIRGSLGFATNDCFRGSLGWTTRNFLGGGRILDLSSRVSKVGVGDPLDWGLADGICGSVAEDTIGSAKINYNLTGAVRRPAFLSPYNAIAFSVFTERRSEFKVYLRRETGASVTFTRETYGRRRLPLSLTYTVSYGSTEATAANFCAFFNACTPDVLEPLQENRMLATVTGLITRPRINNPLDPTRGSLMSVEVTHASKYIGSSELQQFTRGIFDAAWYRPLTRDVVLSWRLRGGVIVAPRQGVAGETGAFIPPEQRFYAGGPNDVRGFERNELGPVVYVVPKTHVDDVSAAGRPLDPDSVRVAATGGNTLAVANVELRFPSPILRSRMRLAAFVDAGGVWQRNLATSPALIRITPGIGIRVATPLGPVRLDVAYNPYKRQPGTLFQFDTTGTLTPVPGQSSYVLERDGKFTLHFAVGQPF